MHRLRGLVKSRGALHLSLAAVSHKDLFSKAKQYLHFPIKRKNGLSAPILPTPITIQHPSGKASPP